MLTLMKALRPTDNIEPDCWLFDLQRREWLRESDRVAATDPKTGHAPPPAIMLGGNPETFDWSYLEHALRLFQRWEDNVRWRENAPHTTHKKVSCTLTHDSMARLDALAKEAGLTREAMATVLLEERLKK